MKIRPLSDHLLVKRVEPKDSVKGGIIIPDSAKEKPQEALVKAVGPGKREEGKVMPIDIKVGDRVLISKYGGSEITIEDEEVLIIREDDVLGVIEK